MHTHVQCLPWKGLHADPNTGAQIFIGGLLLPPSPCPQAIFWALPASLPWEPGQEPDSDPDLSPPPPGKSALHWAAAVNNVEATLALLKNGANKDMQDSKVSPRPWPTWGSALPSPPPPPR